jgi:multisubunit Na+/H+ antiporter MnhG subunit
MKRMFNSFKRQWSSLRHSRPGHRFQDRYERNQKTKKNQSWVGRILRMAAAAVAFVIGVILVFIPGPAFVFFALAGALVASESLVVARSLDWIEVKIRAVVTWCGRHWKRLHAVGKVAVVGVVAIAGGAAAYASYRVFLD